MRDDDRDEPFEDFFDEIERMMNEMMGSNAEFHFEHTSGTGGSDSRDVHTNIHESDEEVRVVADIPGLEKDDIGLKCDGRTLSIQATGDNREYSERLSLPARVDEHSAAATYNNGVLEVRFDRSDDSTSIDI
jgi:HSP20 family protein